MSRETGWYMIWYLGDIRGNRLSKRVWEMQSFSNPYLERLVSVNFPRNSGHQESDEYNHFWRCANGRET